MQQIVCPLSYEGDKFQPLTTANAKKREQKAEAKANVKIRQPTLKQSTESNILNGKQSRIGEVFIRKRGRGEYAEARRESRQFKEIRKANEANKRQRIIEDHTGFEIAIAKPLSESGAMDDSQLANTPRLAFV